MGKYTKRKYSKVKAKNTKKLRNKPKPKLIKRTYRHKNKKTKKKGGADPNETPEQQRERRRRQAAHRARLAEARARGQRPSQLQGLDEPLPRPSQQLRERVQQIEASRRQAEAAAQQVPSSSGASGQSQPRPSSTASGQSQPRGSSGAAGQSQPRGSSGAPRQSQPRPASASVSQQAQLPAAQSPELQGSALTAHQDRQFESSAARDFARERLGLRYSQQPSSVQENIRALRLQDQDRERELTQLRQQQENIPAMMLVRELKLSFPNAKLLASRFNNNVDNAIRAFKDPSIQLPPALMQARQEYLSGAGGGGGEIRRSASGAGGGGGVLPPPIDRPSQVFVSDEQIAQFIGEAPGADIQLARHLIAISNGDVQQALQLYRESGGEMVQSTPAQAISPDQIRRFIDQVPEADEDTARNLIAAAGSVEAAVQVYREQQSQAQMQATGASGASGAAEGDDEAALCPICQGEFEEGEECVRAHPGEPPHVFHKECLEQWRQSGNNNCPTCNQRVQPSPIACPARRSGQVRRSQQPLSASEQRRFREHQEQMRRPREGLDIPPGVDRDAYMRLSPNSREVLRVHLEENPGNIPRELQATGRQASGRQASGRQGIRRGRLGRIPQFAAIPEEQAIPQGQAQQLNPTSRSFLTQVASYAGTNLNPVLTINRGTGGRESVVVVDNTSGRQLSDNEFPISRSTLDNYKWGFISGPNPDRCNGQGEYNYIPLAKRGHCRDILIYKDNHLIELKCAFVASASSNTFRPNRIVIGRQQVQGQLQSPVAFILGEVGPYLKPSDIQPPLSSAHTNYSINGIIHNHPEPSFNNNPRTYFPIRLPLSNEPGHFMYGRINTPYAFKTQSGTITFINQDHPDDL